MSERDERYYKYEWFVRYENGEVYRQFPDTGGEKSIGTCDFDQVKEIFLFDLKDSQAPSFRLRVRRELGEKAIKFWQVTQNALEGDEKYVREVLGIQKNVNGVSVKFFCLIDGDGNVTLSTTDDI